MSEPKALYRSALKYLAAGEIERGVALLRQSVPKDDDFVEAHNAWARAVMPGSDYIEILRFLHEELRPQSYIEIGVEFGTTLRLVGSETQALGVDPAPQIDGELADNIVLYEQKSDDFFAENDLKSIFNDPFDLAFIDGLHIFEQVLRDFINLEKFSSVDSLVLIHDCLPLDSRTAARTRTTQFWSGDVWKIVPCLKHERPDLKLVTIPAYPTGLCLISGLDSESRLLEKNYTEIVERYIAIDYDAIQDKGDYFSLVANDWQLIQETILPIRDNT
ncbi:class I SAM-dependent methyltransferase [bacterium]|nr:class I SAM-dependent methyltransferase [bacterium]